ncbi:MAG: hypothetical protein HGA85_03250 [Nanoarchaeota archaeon]|nr:hypothetical protein [Nanoarchaeota archaeon]
MDNIEDKREEDLPKSIVVVLVVLAVVISVLGTFTVLSELNRVNQAPLYKGASEQSARVSITVLDHKAGLSSATGKVTLRVQRPEGQ